MAGYLDSLVIKYCDIIFTVCQRYAVSLTWNFASIPLDFWVIGEPKTSEQSI